MSGELPVLDVWGSRERGLTPEQWSQYLDGGSLESFVGPAVPLAGLLGPAAEAAVATETAVATEAVATVDILAGLTSAFLAPFLAFFPSELGKEPNVESLQKYRFDPAPIDYPIVEGLPQVDVTAPPFKPPVTDVTAFDPVMPPNWWDLSDPSRFVELPLHIPGIAIGFPLPWDVQEWSPLPYAKPTTGPGLDAGTVSTPGRPGTYDSPVEIVAPWTVESPFSPLSPSPYTRPVPVPDFLASPFGDVGFEPGIEAPTRPTTATPGSPLPGIPFSDFGLDAGFQPINLVSPFASPNAASPPDMADPCGCKKTADKKKKKKKKKKRDDCSEYVVRQFSDGTRQYQKKSIPCESKKGYKRSKDKTTTTTTTTKKTKPKKPKFPGSNPFPTFSFGVF